MMDDGFKSKDEKTSQRPVWSDKAEGGYLEDFLAGGAEKTESPKDEKAAMADEESTKPVTPDDVTTRVTDALKQIYDPEIPVNIYDLGLIYTVETDADHNVKVTMTLTTPHCPVAESMPYEVESRVRSVDGVNDVKVDLVWDPPWDMSLMSDEARLELGLL